MPCHDKAFDVELLESWEDMLFAHNTFVALESLYNKEDARINCGLNRSDSIASLDRRRVADVVFRWVCGFSLARPLLSVTPQLAPWLQ